MNLVIVPSYVPVCMQSTWKKDRFTKDSEEWERTRDRLRSNAAQVNDEDPYENPYVLEPHEVLIESKDVTIEEPVGEGSFGKVYRGQWRNRNTGNNVRRGGGEGRRGEGEGRGRTK